MMESPVDSEPKSPFTANRKYYYLGLLTAAYMFDHVDRQILGVLIEPIKAQFSLNDSQIGLLSGVFVFPYLLVRLPLAAVADKNDRRHIFWRGASRSGAA